MLLHLKIQDLILVEHAEIELGKGLSIFTGETGAGKSAILTAIRLIRGERASSEWIRVGANSAIVEAKISSLPQKLVEGIDLPPKGEPITIRREIHRSGKSRSFIEDQLVSGSILHAALKSLIEIVDQGSSSEITSSLSQRNILDIYIGLEAETGHLSLKYEEMSKLEKELQSMSSLDVRRDLSWSVDRLKEIEEVDWQKEEESSLSQTHLLLTHSQELGEKVGSITHALSQFTPQVRLLSNLLEKASLLDPRLKSCSETLKTAAVEISETDHFLNSYASRLEADPRELDIIEKRIGRIEALKKKFGPSWEEVEKQKINLTQEIHRLETFDETLDALRKKYQTLQEELAQIGGRLSEFRKKGALDLSKVILKELSSLNLPDAQFLVEVKPKPLSANGIDEISFLFTANLNRPLLPLDACASGGELSRLLFATKVILAEKEKTECLVLDEIDSNVGGQTAAILGEKLKKLSKVRQVISVTHFVQVARYADDHFVVSKKEAKTFVERLESHSREIEYARMIGR